jgi:hypothetical protein
MTISPSPSSADDGEGLFEVSDGDFRSEKRIKRRKHPGRLSDSPAVGPRQAVGLP